MDNEAELKSKPKNVRVTCYQCYRFFLQNVEIKGTEEVTKNKDFCSELCRDEFQIHNLLTCQVV